MLRCCHRGYAVIYAAIVDTATAVIDDCLRRLITFFFFIDVIFCSPLIFPDGAHYLLLLITRMRLMRRGAKIYTSLLPLIRFYSWHMAYLF